MPAHFHEQLRIYYRNSTKNTYELHAWDFDLKMVTKKISIGRDCLILTIQLIYLKHVRSMLYRTLEIFCTGFVLYPRGKRVIKDHQAGATQAIFHPRPCLHCLGHNLYNTQYYTSLKAADPA